MFRFGREEVVPAFYVRDWTRKYIPQYMIEVVNLDSQSSNELIDAVLCEQCFYDHSHSIPNPPRCLKHHPQQLMCGNG